jgi:hypothetical protein
MVDERAVVRVWHGKPKDGGEYLGTAFLISPQCLLTAAHVIENSPVSEIYLQGQAWSGIRNLQNAVCHENQNIDVAILYLPKKGDRSVFLPLAPEKDDDLAKGSTVTLLGFGTADSDLENIPVPICSYDGDCDLDVTHTSVARGMSGGPVIANGRVVGLIRARHHDSNKSYLVRLNSFRAFLMGNGCLPERSPENRAETAIPQDEFVGKMRLHIHKELQRKPLKPLAEILQKRVTEAAPEKHGDAAALLCQGNLLESVDLLHGATGECLQKLADDGAREDALQAMWQGALNILGWLVLLSVDHAWVRQHGSSLTNDSADVRFEVPCSTGTGLEVLVARVGSQEPAKFIFDSGGTEVTGQNCISGSAVEAVDWNIGNCALEIKKLIYRKIYQATPPHPFTQQHTDKLNAILKVRGGRGENHYLSIPVTEENNPVCNPEVYRLLRQELTGLRIVYFGIGDGEGMLLLPEVDLFALVYEFLQLIKEYQ